MSQDAKREMSEAELQELVAASDTGGRNPSSDSLKLTIALIAIFWSLFQLWVAQGQDIINNTLIWAEMNKDQGGLAGLMATILPRNIPTLGGDKYRIIHLAFALVLAFLSYPAFKSSPRDRIPLADWALAAIGLIAVVYIYAIFGAENDPRNTSAVTTFQMALGVVGILILAEATRRALGMVLACVAAVMMIFVYFGFMMGFIPINFRPIERDFDTIVRDIWFGDKGVFGIPLGVSAQTVFMFVLFGALLDKAGAGNYFIKMAFGALGHLRGGPAKAAVVGSAATGLISGSSIANVVTTGTFTIPLMRRVGFSREKAGAVEVASSVNGQIMPPVMGAAAFLMVEYIDGVEYLDVVKHAFVPAAISYIALVYLVHLEALKNNMKALEKPGGGETSVLWTIGSFLMGFFVFGLFCYALQFPIRFAEDAFGAFGKPVVVVAAFAVIISLIVSAAKSPDLEPDDPNSENVTLPIVGDIYKTGLYFLVPILVLIYLLMIEMQSAGKSAFFAVIWLLAIMLIQRPVKALVRGDSNLGQAFRDGVAEVIAGLEAGGRNMIGVAIATAAAGAVVALVQLARLDQTMGEIVGFLAGDSLILILILCAVFSLILGMGLPTTANYIIVSTIMVGVIVDLGAQNDLVIPLIAAHLFVFYFGIMADVTPPVGLASFAAAAVSGGDPIRTGFTAFFYSLRTVALPFLFIFNTTLILDFSVDGQMLGIMVGEGLEWWLTALWVFVIATCAMLLFAAGLQGYFITRSRIWESAMLILAAFILFRPGALQNQIQPEFISFPPAEAAAAYAAHEPGREIQIAMSGLETENFEEIIDVSAGLRIEGEDPEGALTEAGYVFEVNPEGTVLLQNPPRETPASEAVGSSLDFFGDGVVVNEIRVQQDRLPSVFFQLPALLLLGLVVLLQNGRAGRTREDEVTV